MKITSPKILKAFLEGNDLRVKKSASQNFLIDGNIVNKVIEEADLSEDDLVVDIGAGPGAFTEALLDKGCRVLAIERDQKLAKLLWRFKKEESSLEVLASDILLEPLEEILDASLQKGTKAKIVANLPFHITAPILTRLLPLHEKLSDIVVIIQKEVAERIVAQTGTKDYSSLSLFVQFFSDVKFCFKVEPQCFMPKPSVQSATLHFKLKPPAKVKNEETFFRLTRAAFGQKRKMLKSSLKDLYNPKILEETLSRLGLNPWARPQELSLSDFLALHEALPPPLESD